MLTTLRRKSLVSEVSRLNASPLPIVVPSTVANDPVSVAKVRNVNDCPTAGAKPASWMTFSVPSSVRLPPTFRKPLPLGPTSISSSEVDCNARSPNSPTCPLQSIARRCR